MSILLAGLGLGLVIGFECGRLFYDGAGGGHRGPIEGAPPMPMTTGPVSVVPPPRIVAAAARFVDEPV